MSAPITTLAIDCMATARRILSSPVAVYSATPFEIVAMAACTVRESTGEMPELPVVADPPPSLPAQLLAAAGRRLLDACSSHDDACRDIAAGRLPADNLAIFVEGRTAAIEEFRTLMEKEFPNGSHSL